MNEIYLRFDKMIVGLAGYDYGKTVYEEQVSNKIDFSKKIIIVFPDQIQRIASSFIQGFFDEIVKRIGIAGIEKQIEIKEIDIAKEFIETMLHNAKINADVIATQENNLIKIDIKGKEATNANKDIVVEEQITAKDVNSKKKQISLLNIVFSSLMLLAFLIFGFSEFYEISNLSYFSLYDILFSLG